VLSADLGREYVDVLEAYVANLGSRKVEVKAIPVVRALPVLKDLHAGSNGRVGVST
jgi:hypothetical protein